MDQKRENTFAGILRSNLFAVVFFVAVAALILGGINRTKDSRRQQALRSAEDSIRRAVVTCYAIEGSYPESFEYITEHYGVYINKDEFAVFYNVFGENVMPSFTVLEK